MRKKKRNRIAWWKRKKSGQKKVKKIIFWPCKWLRKKYRPLIGDLKKSFFLDPCWKRFALKNSQKFSPLLGDEIKRKKETALKRRTSWFFQTLFFPKGEKKPSEKTVMCDASNRPYLFIPLSPPAPLPTGKGGVKEKQIDWRKFLSKFSP